MVENYIWMAGQNQECLPTDWTEVEDKDACNGIEGNWLNRTGFTLKKDQHKKKLNYLSSLPQCFNTFLLKETSVTYHASNLLKKRKKKFIFCFAAAAAKSLQSCPTLCDPIDGSPPGFPCPWDSPGKNIGVGCHFLLQCMKVKSESEVAQLCLTLSNSMDWSTPGSSIHGFSRQEYWSGVPLTSRAVPA